MNDEAATASTGALFEQPVEQLVAQPVEEQVQPVEHEPSEITYVESFYPARPRQLLGQLLGGEACGFVVHPSSGSACVPRSRSE